MRRIISGLLIALMTMASIPTQAQDAAAVPFVGGIFHKSGTVGALGTAVVGGLAIHQYGAKGRDKEMAAVSRAVHEWGTPAGNAALIEAQQQIHSHPFAGPKGALDELVNDVAVQPSLDGAARQVAAALGLNVRVYEQRVAEARAQSTAVATTAPQADNSCQNDDDEPAAKVKRNTPGIARGGEALPFIADGAKWWLGTHGNAARIPGQVAARLRGMGFRNFDGLRNAIWREIGNDPVLSRGFDAQTLERMKSGGSPFVDKSQVLYPKNGNNPPLSNKVYHIHHMQPISRGGAVYSFDNLVIITPLCHDQLLDNPYHKGAANE